MRLSPPLVRSSALPPPPWVDRFLDGSGSRSSLAGRGSFTLETLEGPDAVFFEAHAADAGELAGDAFERRVEEVYDGILAELARRRLQPLRFWNFVPGILRSSRDGLYRYELFNLGRYAAFRRWYGTEDFGRRLSAASAVDCHRPGLVVQALAAPRTGRPVENPRQIPAYRYSARFGPLPPCFARASVVQLPASPAEWVVVSGTASVLGEDSQHQDDLPRQLHETLRNLATVVAASTGEAEGLLEKELAGPVPGLGVAPGSDTSGTSEAAPCPYLSRLTQLRAYVVRSKDHEVVAEALRSACPQAQELEVLPADLCRPDLLVEVEGIAVLPSLGS